ASANSFRSHNAEVRVQQVRTTAEPSAIGSELKRGQEQETPVEQPASRSSPSKNQAKLRSPEKETKPQEGSAKKDWGAFEDEEDNDEQLKQEEA
ncbi:hypothetical protein OV760_30035, partial [Salmonella enterica subsp. enterica serovar 1,4,[5],12:i:-]|nr:hypothetical protein [Salmonella enterica subsp. enterica serovar 1,4,[5],12:i:-]